MSECVLDAYCIGGGVHTDFAKISEELSHINLVYRTSSPWSCAISSTILLVVQQLSPTRMTAGKCLLFSCSRTEYIRNMYVV